jgi:hypothetical protein
MNRLIELMVVYMFFVLVVDPLFGIGPYARGKNNDRDSQREQNRRIPRRGE